MSAIPIATSFISEADAATIKYAEKIGFANATIGAATHALELEELSIVELLMGALLVFFERRRDFDDDRAFNVDAQRSADIAGRVMKSVDTCSALGISW